MDSAVTLRDLSSCVNADDENKSTGSIQYSKQITYLIQFVITNSTFSNCIHQKMIVHRTNVSFKTEVNDEDKDWSRRLGTNSYKTLNL